jgi:hypothetical protein
VEIGDVPVKSTSMPLSPMVSRATRSIGRS